MNFSLYYEDLPFTTRTGRKDVKMPKTTKEATPKTRKSYSKTRSEHYKDLVIAVLITAIVAFIAGVVFQSKQTDAIVGAIKAVKPEAQAEQLK
jgi:anti-sigma-K factor RskA